MPTSSPTSWYQTLMAPAQLTYKRPYRWLASALICRPWPSMPIGGPGGLEEATPVFGVGDGINDGVVDGRSLGDDSWH
jgi:hypothetical protein